MFHQSFHPRSQFHNQRMPNQFYKHPPSSFYQSGARANRSSQNLNYSRDFERFPMPPHGFNSVPKGPYPFWRQNLGQFQRQYPRTSAFHFQDQSTFYYMSDPIRTHDNRITIQLTKVHIGPNGDQQRVFVEQEFSNENELKKFMKNLRSNFEKTFNNHEENRSTSSKKSGVIVIEEPDEEPRVYEQHENLQSSFVNHEQEQRLPFIPSCSTVQSSKRRKNKMKSEQHNDFPIPPNPNPHWRFPGHQNRSRPTRMKYQEKPPLFRRTQQQQPPPRTIGENLVFTNNKQQQPRVDRSQSECQTKIPLRNPNKTPQYVDYRQRYSTPIVFPSTPRVYRNTQVQYRLFNLYQPNSNHF